MRRYLLEEAPRLLAAAVLRKVAASHTALEGALRGLDEGDVGERRNSGWSIREVVDHLAQTNIRAAEELRHLIAGRRPPEPPVYEGLLSGAATRAAWVELLGGLHASNAELQAVLATVVEDGNEGVTANTIVVVKSGREDGSVEALVLPLELEWRAYAMVQRLHAIDHRQEVSRLRARR